jgi:hypothetical protein
MDTMTLSYADVALAKDVLYGLYADTAARGQPQAPCQNEDGTTNMECALQYQHLMPHLRRLAVAPSPHVAHG